VAHGLFFLPVFLSLSHIDMSSSLIYICQIMVIVLVCPQIHEFASKSGKIPDTNAFIHLSLGSKFLRSSPREIKFLYLFSRDSNRPRHATLAVGTKPVPEFQESEIVPSFRFRYPLLQQSPAFTSTISRILPTTRARFSQGGVHPRAAGELLQNWRRHLGH
jgi:hypothetical protein